MQLYEALHVGEHQLKKERHLMAQLEQLQSQILPLEQVSSSFFLPLSCNFFLGTFNGRCLLHVRKVLTREIGIPFLDVKTKKKKREKIRILAV
jgi:hypothetical protein